MSKNKKPKSETTPATPNPIVATRANLIIKVAERMKANRLDKLSDDNVAEFVNAVYILLRDLGCHASITSPVEVVEEAEVVDIKLTIKQAKRVCENLQDNDWLGEQYCTTLTELIEDQAKN